MTKRLLNHLGFQTLIVFLLFVIGNHFSYGQNTLNFSGLSHSDKDDIGNPYSVNSSTEKFNFEIIESGSPNHFFYNTSNIAPGNCTPPAIDYIDVGNTTPSAWSIGVDSGNEINLNSITFVNPFYCGNSGFFAYDIQIQGYKNGVLKGTTATQSINGYTKLIDLSSNTNFDDIDSVVVVSISLTTNLGIQAIEWEAVVPPCSAPTTQATSTVFGSETSSTLSLNSFTAPVGGADGYAVYINSTNSFTAPSNGDEPTADLSWNNAGQQAVYFGTSASPNIAVTGLDASTTYHFQIYAYNDCSGTNTFEATGLNTNDITALDCTTPPDQDFGTHVDNGFNETPKTYECIVYSGPGQITLIGDIDDERITDSPLFSDSAVVFFSNTSTGSYGEFRSVSNANNFKIVSLIADFLGHSADSPEIYNIVGYDNGVETVRVNGFTITTTGSYGTGNAAINWNRINHTGTLGSNTGTLTFGSGWSNIDEVRFEAADAAPNNLIYFALDHLDFDTAVSNSAPALGGAPTDDTATEDVATAINLSAYNISDADGDIVTLRLAVDRGTIASTDGNGTTAGITIANSGTALMTLQGTVANLNTYLDDTSKITYTTASNDTTTATLIVTPNDGTVNGTADTVDISISAVNDNPTVSSVPTDVTVTEDTASNVALSAITFSDVDSANITVTLTASAGIFSAPADGAGVGGGITETLQSATVITLVGNPADINTYLDTASNIQYTAASNASGNAAATITITANDGDGSGNVNLGTVNVNITAVNDNPLASGIPASVTVTEDTASNVDLSAITFSDVDSATITVTLTASAGTFSAPADGAGVGGGVTETLQSATVITLVGNPADINTYLDKASNIQYTGASNVNGNAAATITITANDGNGSGDINLGTVNVNITAVNDAPTATGIPANITVTEDTASNVDLSVITFSDVDSATITVTLTASAGTFSPPADGAGVGGGVTETLQSATVITLVGNLADINTYLDTASNIQYTGASNASGNAAATITITANDGDGSGDINMGTVNVDINRMPPVFENSTPSSSNILGTSFTLEIDIDEAGTIYYVVIADGASAPTSAEIKAGTGSGGFGQITAGSQAVNSGSFTHNFNVSGLTLTTAYDVYVVTEDDHVSPSLQALPTKIDVTTSSVLGIEAVTLKNAVILYPNPFNDKLNIKASNANIESVLLFDILGKQIDNVELQEDNSLDMSNLNSGIYLLKVTTDKGSIVKRIIKN